MPPSRPARDERGHSLSSFVAVVVVALLLVAGLVVDGGAQVAADRRAEQAAASAARAAVDAGAVTRVAGRPVDLTAAQRAATEALADAGVDGSVAVSATSVTVETSTSVPTVFLSLIGVASLGATGQAEAELRAS